jgi:starch phosphorylase
MEERSADFPEAWVEVRKHIIFTTHTPVLAGNEEHSLKDLRRMGACLQLSGAEMRALGGDPFNMTVAGLRLARKANAVARLHGETARAMWAHVDNAAPITHVTNGVHAPTWQDPRVRAARHDPAKLWEAHLALKRELVAEVQRRNQVALDPESLTIGFARRAAGYKRSDLILRDEARIESLLANHSVNLLFSGKAHPDDRTGKAIVARLVKAQQKHPGRVVFIENYEMTIARTLVRGADVWLNNPTRPLEASGTSGMKAAMNGVLNQSVLDGWWPEGCRHRETGWAIGDNTNTDDDTDLKNIYKVLEGDVLPAWKDEARWRRMMVQSVIMGETLFSSDRMVSDYFKTMYAEQPAPEAAPPPIATPDV